VREMHKAIPLILLNFPVNAFDEPAPFGFNWGLLDKVPTPSHATREANVTLLIYRHDRLPSEELRGTEEIILEVCKKEGLQQIIWISKFLSDSEEHDALDSILAEGRRRYGQTEVEEGGFLRWNGGQITVAAGSNDQGLHRIFMVSSGPKLDGCSEDHRAITGHPVSDHWMRFLTNTGTK